MTKIKTISLALATVATLATSGCAPGKNAAGVVANRPGMSDVGQSTCGVRQSSAKPLVVEWPAAERGALEARMQRGLVPVRYAGCEMEVLTTCSVAEAYDYVGITQKTEAVRIKDADALYANLPVGAASLEAKLERSGQLNVDMNIVGRYESARYHFDPNDLSGRCDGATHIVTALTTGSFVFYSGAAVEMGAGGGVAGVGGAGVNSSSEQEVLNTDGNAEACAAAQSSDQSPPEGCGALLRIEVVPIDEIPANGTGPAAGAAGGPSDSGPSPQSEELRRTKASLVGWQILNVTSWTLAAASFVPIGIGVAVLAGGGSEGLPIGLITGGIFGLAVFSATGAVAANKVKFFKRRRAELSSVGIVPTQGGAAVSLGLRF